MSEPRPPRRHGPMLLIVGVLLAGAGTLCWIGVGAVAADYDGFVSWFNPVGAASCCGAAVLLFTVPLVMWLFHDEIQRDPPPVDED